MDIPFTSIDPSLLRGLAPLIEPLAGPALLTVARFCGLVFTAPLISSPVIPWRLRIAIAFVLGVTCAATVTPSVPAVGWDINLVWHALLELGVGAAIGFSAKLLLAGLDLAAGLIDQQAGFTSSGLLHPDQESVTGPTAAGLTVLAGLIWLLLSPLGGDLRIMAAMIDSLRALPPGSVSDLQSPVQFIRSVLSASCLFGLQVAAPVVLSVGLLQMMWHSLARSRRGMTWLLPLSPLRILLGLLVLAATVTETGDAVAQRINSLFDEMPAVATTDRESR